MNAQSKAKLLTRRVIHLTQRILFRLRWFPFTLFLLLLNALFMQLRRRLVIVPVGEALTETQTLLRDAMVWLDSVPAAPLYHELDVCFRLSPQAANANLHDLFSAALAFPRFRSIGLYWDSARLADDLVLWQGTSKSGDQPARRVTPYDLAASGAARLQEFLHADHKEIALPVAAGRDAETLIKRRVGGAWVVCLNLPAELDLDVETIATARPDIHFLDFNLASSSAKAVNCESVFAHGFTLHERMALIRAADAYIGGFDELGCTALISERSSLVIGGGDGNDVVRISLDNAVWVYGPLNPTAALMQVIDFLSRYF